MKPDAETQDEEDGDPEDTPDAEPEEPQEDIPAANKPEEKDDGPASMDEMEDAEAEFLVQHKSEHGKTPKKSRQSAAKPTAGAKKAVKA